MAPLMGHLMTARYAVQGTLATCQGSACNLVAVGAASNGLELRVQNAAGTQRGHDPPGQLHLCLQEHLARLMPCTLAASVLTGRPGIQAGQAQSALSTACQLSTAGSTTSAAGGARCQHEEGPARAARARRVYSCAG